MNEWGFRARKELNLYTDNEELHFKSLNLIDLIADVITLYYTMKIQSSIITWFRLL
jgi:hypothetical protein